MTQRWTPYNDSHPSCALCFVQFRICGGALTPVEISGTLDLQPDKTVKKGDVFRFFTGKTTEHLADLNSSTRGLSRSQFLVLQNWDTDTRDHGYEPGYYTWREGDVWRHSDRWGRPGEPANYFYARNSRQ